MDSIRLRKSHFFESFSQKIDVFDGGFLINVWMLCFVQNLIVLFSIHLLLAGVPPMRLSVYNIYTLAWALAIAATVLSRRLRFDSFLEDTKGVPPRDCARGITVKLVAFFWHYICRQIGVFPIKTIPLQFVHSPISPPMFFSFFSVSEREETTQSRRKSEVWPIFWKYYGTYF